MFVISVIQPTYHRSTDAITGYQMVRTDENSYATLQEAYDALVKINSDDTSDNFCIVSNTDTGRFMNDCFDSVDAYYTGPFDWSVPF